MRGFPRRLIAGLFLASILVGAVIPSQSDAVRPWLNRVDKPISQIFMEQDRVRMDQLHYGIDFPPYTWASQRWDTLTAMFEGEFINCNDDLISSADETFVLFRQGEDGVYYTYRHITPGSVERLFGHDCDYVREHTPAVDSSTTVAESWHNPGELFDLHFEASTTLPLGTNDYVHNPLLDFEDDLLVVDPNDPFVSDCQWSQNGPWGTVRFKALDKTWNNGVFDYDPDYDWPNGFRTGVYRAWVEDRWIGDGGIVYYETRGSWQLDYYWTTNFDDLYSCDSDTDCYYVLDFEVGQESVPHDYTLYVQDYSGRPPAYCGYLGIDREITDVVATPDYQVVEISWYASSFDHGTLFYVDRSADGGITYDHRLRDEWGEPLFVVYTEDGTYSMSDSSVEYDFPYCYRVVDNEGGPGPDPYWEMDELMQGEIGGVPDPPLPTPPPQISFKSMTVADDVGYVGIWFDNGTDWAGWYIAGFDEDGPPYTQEVVHFGTRELSLGDLVPGTTYHIAAKGESPLGSTSFSTEVVFTVVPPTTLLSVDVVDHTSIVATWQSVAVAEGYDLIVTKMHPEPEDTVIDAGADTTLRVDDLVEYEEYCIRVKCRDGYGNRTVSSNQEYIVTDGFGGVGDFVSSGPPDEDRVSQNCPNPFNPETRIPYQISASGSVRISIYDVAGRLVRTVINAHHTPGSYIARWDGRNAQGGMSPAGVYFARFSTPSTDQTKKMILAK